MFSGRHGQGLCLFVDIHGCYKDAERGIGGVLWGVILFNGKLMMRLHVHNWGVFILVDC